MDPKSTKPSSNLYLLKQTRENKGLSLENIHEATKIPMDVLRAIEDGYRVKSVSPFYYKSFIKIYATFLELNPSEILEGTEAEKPIEAPKRPAPASNVSNVDVLAWVNSPSVKKFKKQIFVGVVVIIGLFVVVKIFGWIKTKWANRPIKPKVETVKKIEKKEKKEPAKPIVKEKANVVEKVKETEGSNAQAPVAQATVNVVQPLPTPPTASKNVTLTVRAKKNNWLLVKADDQIVFQSTLGTGSVETWLANEKIEISGRNLSQLEFELNGKMIGTLGREDRQANRIIFTKEGLSVAK